MFQGSLAEVKLPDIIQLMSVGAKTGSFVLSRDGQEGRIYLREGQIIHATLGDLVGEDAIYSVAIWDEGSFTFELGVAAEESTVTKRNTTILMEVARKLEEWRVLKKKVPSLDLIPELNSLGHKKVSFNTQEWHVLSKINGVNSITGIALLTNLQAIDVAKLIYGLVAGGLVKLREEPKANPDINPLEADQQTNKSESKDRDADEEREWLSRKIEKIYQYAKQVLDESAHSVVKRHCAAGMKAVKDGKGLSAVIDTATKIVKVAKALEDPRSQELTNGLKKIIKEA